MATVNGITIVDYAHIQDCPLCGRPVNLMREHTVLINDTGDWECLQCHNERRNTAPDADNIKDTDCDE